MRLADVARLELGDQLSGHVALREGEPFVLVEETVLPDRQLTVRSRIRWAQRTRTSTAALIAGGSPLGRRSGASLLYRWNPFSLKSLRQAFTT
jgi:hypothetical protein